MVEFESPIGKMSIDGGAPPRRFSVSDESEQSAPAQRRITPEELMEMRGKQRQLNQTPDKDIKTRIEYLVGIGRGTIDAPVDMGDDKQMVYSLRTLKGKEMRKIVELGNKIATTRNPVDIYELRLTTLVFSIYQIDKAPIDDVLGISSYSEEEIYNFRADFIDNLDDVVISYLFDKCQEMTRKNKEKYGINTVKDAKEVAEQTNKSGEGVRS